MKIGAFNRILIGILSFFIFMSCAKDNLADPEDDFDGDSGYYSLNAPAFFPEIPQFPDNEFSKSGFELGRHLFYEPLLSATKTVSCSTCHHQDLAFSDGLVLSNTGISGKSLERHSPVIFNLVWTDAGFFWDGGAKNLESQAFAPLTHPDEMGIFFPEMTARLAAIPMYMDLFQRAFGEPPSAAGVAKALAQFQRALISSNSPYDKYRRKPGLNKMTNVEIRGLHLVQDKCGNCHSGELFTDNSFHNNGIDEKFDDDSHEEVYFGRFRITRDMADMGAFKTPSLRNVMVSAPYMHDGRFASIDQVLNHYRFGIHDSPHTDPRLYNSDGSPGIALTSKEVEDIKSFLQALTDKEFLTDKHFSNPHKH